MPYASIGAMTLESTADFDYASWGIVQQTPAPPPNDNCNAATIINTTTSFAIDVIDYSLPPNDDSINATPILSLPYTVSGTNLGALTDFDFNDGIICCFPPPFHHLPDCIQPPWGVYRVSFK